MLSDVGSRKGYSGYEFDSALAASYSLRPTALPTVSVEAGYSKRRRRDVQPLRESLV